MSFQPMTYPLSRKYSADAEPLVPALKLSTKRTVLCSKGTVVPPDYKKIAKMAKNQNTKEKEMKIETQKCTANHINSH